VDGLTIKGNGAVDQFGTDGLFENLLVLVEPKNGGPTGYGAGILLREGAQRNTIRHSTVLPVNAPCLKVLGKANRIQNCVLLSKKPSDTADAELEGNFTAGDPQLGEDNAPKRGSPLIGAAKGESPKKDHAGRPRPAPASVGAFEPSK
jgi:hypothetical protein